jgi:hypothetical protein
MPGKPALHYVTAYADSAPAIGLATHSLLFTHIPKTAGTTLDYILRAIAASSRIPQRRAMGTVYGHFLGAGKGEAMLEFGRFPEAFFRQQAFLSGHVPHGMHRVLSHPYFYVTVLREPIARLLSQYRFGIRRGGWSEKASVTELVEKGLIIDNLQTRMLAGLSDRSAPCTAETLKLAIEHLRSEYAIVGTTERFDETLKLLITLLGWPDIAYGNRQVGEGDASPDQIEQARAAIPQHYAYDHELYIAARELAGQNLARLLTGKPEGSKRQDRVMTCIPGSSVDGTEQALMTAERFDREFAPVLKTNGFDIAFV